MATSELSGLDLERLRADTPGASERIHFNNAGAGLMPKPVLDAMTSHLELEARIGGYEAADAQAAAFDDFYVQVARFVGARPENVAFANNATDAYARALSAIPFERGDVILTTRNDYISNQIAFFSLGRRFGVEVVHAPDAPEGGVDLDAITAVMRERRPRLVAVTHIPELRLVQPVAEIGRVARELDLLYLVDACQSIGQYRLDLDELGADFLSVTGRKFLRGPRGSGFLVVSDRVLDSPLEPLFVDMRGARWTGPMSYERVPDAKRFEDWEFSYALVLGLTEAVRYAFDVGVDVVEARTPALGTALRDRLAKIDRVRILDPGRERCAIVTFDVEGHDDSEGFKRAFDERRINTSIGRREWALLDFDDKGADWALRLSPHYYNTEQEIDDVVSAAEEIVAGL